MMDTIWPVKDTIWPLRCCRGSVHALVVLVPAQTQPLIGIRGGCTQGTGAGCVTTPVSAVGLCEGGSASTESPPQHTGHFDFPVAALLPSARRANKRAHTSLPGGAHLINPSRIRMQTQPPFLCLGNSALITGSLLYPQPLFSSFTPAR